MHLVKPGRKSKTYHLGLATIILSLVIMAVTPLPALAARYATNTGTVTATASGSTQINVVATYTTGGTSCSSGTDNAPTFEVQWDVAPADWVGYGTSGALADAGAVSPFNYSITTGLTPGQTYAVRVIYNDTNGVNTCGGASQTVNGNSVTLPNNSLVVGTSSATVDSTTQITVTSTFTADANNNSTTKVEYNTSNTWPGTVKCSSISGSSPRTCVSNGLLSGTQYWFRITHTDADGVSGTNPQIIGPYTTPSDLTVGTNTAVVDSPTQITVTATFTGDTDNNSTTKVEYNTSNTWPGTVKCASISGSSPRTCVSDGLQPSTQYWFRITHTDPNGVSGTNPQVIGPYTTQAAAKMNCGSCHGAVSKTKAYEAPGLPLNPDNCNNTGRGLHGTHNNYSSTTFKTNAGQRGNCAYCHMAVTTMSPTATHNNNYLNITSYNSGGINTTGLRFNAGNCTNTCHKNRAQAAPWGNYTATTAGGIKLNCRSCHDDSQDKVGLSGDHNIHLLSNCTTPSGTRMSETANAGCVNCHPDNRNDLWKNGKADDGTVKAYPHALDGTNVLADNADLQGQISAATKSGTNTTCTNGCHGRMAVTWGQAMDCNMCHYWAAAPTDTDNTGPGSLSAGHNTHFKAGKSCTNCHPNNTDTAHVSRLPVQSYNANIVKPGMSYNLPAKTCTNTGTGCHNNPTLPTPVWGTTGNGCMTCHNYPDGANWSPGNGHAVQHSASGGNNTHLLDVASYSRTLDTYSSVVNNAGKCGKCHKGLKTNHNNGTTNLNSTGIGYGYCSADFTITVNTPGADVKCSNVKCHSGKITPNWW